MNPHYSPWILTIPHQSSVLLMSPHCSSLILTIHSSSQIRAGNEHRCPNTNKRSARTGNEHNTCSGEHKHEHEHCPHPNTNTNTTQTHVQDEAKRKNAAGSLRGWEAGSRQARTPNKTQRLNRTLNTTKRDPNTEHRTHPNTKPNTFRNRTPNTTTNTNSRFPNTEQCSLPTLLIKWATPVTSQATQITTGGSKR